MLKKIFCGIALSALATGAPAALIGRDLNGSPGSFEAFYDTALNITWMADAGLSQSNSFGVTGIDSLGRMTWYTANDWIAAMNTANYLGFSDWRLPTTLQPDPSCSVQSTVAGYPVQGSGICTGSEFGHLNRVDGVSANNAFFFGFSNVRVGSYWSGTSYAPLDGNAWMYDMWLGRQTFNAKTLIGYVWAVRTGDSLTAPIPAALWLFGGALGVLAGVRRLQTR